jgi:hypothetical protein
MILVWPPLIFPSLVETMERNEEGAQTSSYWNVVENDNKQLSGKKPPFEHPMSKTMKLLH